MKIQPAWAAASAVHHSLHPGLHRLQPRRISRQDADAPASRAGLPREQARLIRVRAGTRGAGEGNLFVDSAHPAYRLFTVFVDRGDPGNAADAF